MHRRELVRLFASAALGLGVLAARNSTAMAPMGLHADMYGICVKACTDCQASCSACVKHCEGMIKAGNAAHGKSKKLAEDCRDICAAAAKLTARKGPMSAAICDACAKACDACGAECVKYPDMKTMQDCVKSCKACAKACRAMAASHKA